MRIKGVDRARKQRKRRYGMRVDGAAVRRVQLALLQRALRQGSAFTNKQ